MLSVGFVQPRMIEPLWAGAQMPMPSGPLSAVTVPPLIVMEPLLAKMPLPYSPPLAVTVPPLIVTESPASMPSPFVPSAVTVPVPFVWP